MSFLAFSPAGPASPTSAAVIERESTSRHFELPSDFADRSFKLFSEQAEVQLLFPTDLVRAIRTRAVHGTATPREALEQMIAGTPLIVVQDERTGALGVKRRPSEIPESNPVPAASAVRKPPVRRGPLALVLGVVALLQPQIVSGQTAPDLAESQDENEVILLSPFKVDATQDRGYQATSTLAGTRIRTDLADIGSAISVLTKEMITDLGGHDNQTVLAYAVNTEVAGPRGNFSGANRAGREGHIEEQGSFTNPNGNTRVRGLVAADNTRDFFLSDVPWDGYNIARVDLQRGPNAILFGLGSPAGVINAASNPAMFANRGSVEATFDRYGTQRFALDLNRNLIDRQLAVRVALLDHHQKFQQQPAYAHDRRAYGALKFAPAALNKDGVLFEVSGNFEHGEIRSNRPRQVPPEDYITQFWKPVAAGGVARKTFDLYRDFLGQTFADDSANPLYDQYHTVITGGLAGGNVNQLVNSAGGVAWLREAVQAFGALDPTGAVITGAQGPNNAGPYPQNVGPQSVVGVQQWSGAAGLPYASVGAYKNEVITDPSIFDFYHHLIDGPNKHEWNNWNVYTVDLTNTFFHNLVGYDLTYFKQRLDQGMWTALGWEGNAFRIDINERLFDGTPNPDVGRAYVGARTGDMGSFTNRSNRYAYRAQGFLDYNFADRHHGFWARLAGDQRLTVVYSEEDQETDLRNFQFANWDGDTLARFGPSGLISNPDVGAGFRHYLGSDLRSASSSSGLHLSGLSSPFARSGGGVEAIRWFDPTWVAPASVVPGAAWSNPRDPNHMFSDAYTQSQNPANYRGWTSVNGHYVTLNSKEAVGGMSAQDYLTANATLTDFNVKSQIGVWQGTFWDHAVVGVFGYRKDKARKYEYVTSDRQHNANPATGGADLRASTYNYNNPAALISNTEAITRNWSVMLHVNKLLGTRDFLPLNLRLYYSRGENFQPLAGRIDAFGLPIPNPGGTTKDASVMLSTKDDRFTLRVTKYETTIINATSTDGQLQNTWALEQALGDNLGEFSSSPAIIRGYLKGTLSYSDYADAGGDPDKLRNAIIPAWLAFEKELKTRFPDFVNSWMGPNSSWGTDNLETPTITAPVGFVATEDSMSEGYEAEFIANPTKNWRIAINGSKTEAVRNNVPGANFRAVASFVDDAFQNTDVGLVPVWWPQNFMGARSVGPYPFFFRSDWLRVSNLNGQSAGEVRRYRANAITTYEFDHGSLKGVGIGGGYRWEDRSIIAYAPKINEDGSYGVNLDAPFYAPREDTVDLWLSYTRKLTSNIRWRIQLNVYNAGEKNRLVPIAAGVDPAAVVGLTPTPTTIVPMKATAFSIRQGMSWQLTNTFEF